MTAAAGELRDLLARAAEWRLLSVLLSRPCPGWREEVAALAREVDDPVLRQAAAEAGSAGEGAYHALLGAGGPASPREAAHLGFVDPGRVLADLAAWYSAFGFTPRPDEAHDHLAVESDFVSYLYLKEAYAVAAGQPDAAGVTRDARARFLSEHAAKAGKRMPDKLPEGAPPYLAAAARAAAARLPDVPPAAGPAVDDDPLKDGCGGCTEACR